MSDDQETKAPFHDDRDLREIKIERVLRFDQGGRAAVILGSFEEKAILLSLDQKAACSNEEAMCALIPELKLSMKNFSGGEYSYYDGMSPFANYNIEVIWPAQERQIQRKTPAEWALLEESAEAYREVSLAYVEERSAKEAWIDSVTSLRTEKERNLFVSDQFIINVDTKWNTHGELTTNEIARKAWHGASWTTDLYLLAISRDLSLRSIRDLDGNAIGLLREMKAALIQCALNIYGVPKHKIRIFFHYHPQFYRLHAHCTRIEYNNPGCESERAHLVDAVITNLQLDTNYYRNATLPAKLRVGEKLYTLLTNHTITRAAKIKKSY